MTEAVIRRCYCDMPQRPESEYTGHPLGGNGCRNTLTPPADMRERIRWQVDQAPPLSFDQRCRISVLMRAGAKTSGADVEAAVREEKARRAAEEATLRREAEERAARREEERRAAAARCALYRHFDSSGQLLYVGISDNSSRRRSQHIRDAVWARFHDRETVEWLKDRASALAAETRAIVEERPVFNKVGATEGARERRLRYLFEREAWDLLSDKAP